MDIVAETQALLVTMGAAPVMWLMIFLSFASVAVMVERAIFFRLLRDDLPRLLRSLHERLLADDLDGAREALERSRSAEAAVVLAGLLEARRGLGAAREAMVGALSLQRQRLERRLSFLGTLGANAPFIGLFGTVIGIVMAFDALARAGAESAGSEAVMASIAEALVATAIGLGVAIPAVVAFNVFQRKIKGILGQTDALSRVLLAHLEAGAVRASPGALHDSEIRVRSGARSSEVR